MSINIRFGNACDPPCRNCEAPVRHPGCHAKCSKYASFTAKRDEAKKKVALETKCRDFDIERARRRYSK